ncbi:Cytochrome P450 3A31 [Fragariocoptes setiger]|uniref:Cytochrome P450 3A31 n=1 Tax=Fragariocoptes setiger TaxID=1670756 RepID=A0ABQ7SBP8_9ACAR|nr:Cytochrome P450 3A31 [Fragariocoptes setiger]
MKFVSLINGKIAKSKDASVVLNVFDYMQVIVLDVIVKTAFDIDVIDVSKGDKDETLLLLNKLMANNDASVTHFIYALPFVKHILNPLVNYVLPNGRKFDAFLRQTVERKIKEIKEQKVQSSQHSSSGESRRVSNEKVIDILVRKYLEGEITLDLIYANSLATLIAGYDTTSLASTYVLWAIAKHPGIQEKLRIDIQLHGTESEYLEMVLKENLRLFPVTANFLMRSPSEDIIVGGRYKILKHSIVTYNYADVHHNAEYWPDPMRFDPERFAPGKTYDKMTFVPFGAGHRVCIGYRLAIKELKLIVTHILRNYRLELVTPQQMERKVKSYFNSQPSESVKVRFCSLASQNGSPLKISSTV